jgi:ComF family protein
VLARPFTFAAWLLWPARCAGCDGFVPEGCSLCEGCAPSLLAVAEACPGCALPARAGARCAACRRDPPPFDGARAAFVYGGALTQALLRLKHGGRLDLARPLGRLLVPWLPEPGAVDAVVPVPLHPRRLRARGYNQALELARAACTRGRPRVDVTLLRRRTDTPSLGHLSPEARRAAVEGAFVARCERARGQRLLLIDDVMTTGSTLRACALTLRAAGALSLHALVLARAVQF